MKKPEPFLIFGLIVIFFVGVGFYLSLAKKIPFREAAQPTPTIYAASPTIKLGITTHWTIFKSNYHYSIKYPADWKLYQSSWFEEEDSRQFDLEKDDEAAVRFREPDQKVTSQEPYGIIIRLKKPVDNPENLTARAWLKNNYPALSLIRTEDIRIADRNCLKVTSLLEGQLTYVFIPDKDKIYQIVKQSSASETYDYDLIFNQILSTFEFSLPFNQ